VRAKLPQMWGWMLAAVMLATVVTVVSPQQFGVLAYKGLMVCVAAVVAHWLDRTFFRDGSDDVSEIARALVFVGVVLGFTLGL